MARITRAIDFACRDDDGAILIAFTQTDLSGAHVVARRMAGVLKNIVVAQRGVSTPANVTLATLKAGDTLESLMQRVTGRPAGCRRVIEGIGLPEKEQAMPEQPPVRIDVVSDVVCPWCFIGKRRLEKAIALKPDIPVEVHWRPYFLNDWVPREGISRDDYLTAKFGSPSATRASPSASPRRPPPPKASPTPSDKISRQPNTTDAHRLIRWAEGIGKAAEMKQKLMDLYFTEGADLTNHAVLVQAAADVGLDAEDVRAALESDKDVAQIEARSGAGQGGRHPGRAHVHLRRQVRRVGRAGAGISRRSHRTRRARPRSG